LPNNIPEELRRFVAKRAEFRCEYCLVHEEDSLSPHQVDHIVGRKHGGGTDPPNLAYACLRCNLWKGSDVGTVDPGTGVAARLFHPRLDRWTEHFEIRGAALEGTTEVGRATVKVLKLNHEHRLAERELLARAGRYPG
jgi:HNH endonuclease